MTTVTHEESMVCRPELGAGSREKVAALVRELTVPLDEGSRYIPELIERLQGAEVLDERLWDNCRGVHHAGPRAFARMSLREKLLANLVTAESRYLRFEANELAGLRTRFRAVAPELQRVLVAPCALGAEAFTLAALGLEANAPMDVLGVDVQPALLAVAGELLAGRASFPESILELACACFGSAGSGQALVWYKQAEGKDARP